MNAKMKELLDRYPTLSPIAADIDKALALMLDTYRKDGKIMVCGNGGSCSDSEHIVGELMKGFLLMRRPEDAFTEKAATLFGAEFAQKAARLQRGIPAISLPSQTAVLSAFVNDVEPDMMYAQLVFGYAKPGDLLIGLSTSGNSANVVNALRIAKTCGIATVALTGARESLASEICDCTIKAPETETFKVQELHLPIYHYLCAAMEETLFGEN